MTKRQSLEIQAEDLVRKVVTETFGQKTGKEILKSAARKVARAVSCQTKDDASAKPAISSNDPP